jgi:sec-independent protein translocase protein TatA
MGAFSFWHLILLLVVILLFFGPNRLPSLGHSLGKAIRGFKEGLNGLDNSTEDLPRNAREAVEPKDSQKS